MIKIIRNSEISATNVNGRLYVFSNGECRCSTLEDIEYFERTNGFEVLPLNPNRKEKSDLEQTDFSLRDKIKTIKIKGKSSEVT